MKKRDVALILLYNVQKEILLQYRDDLAVLLPSCWRFFGGGIESDETPLEAVFRETKEELDYQLHHPNHIFTQNFHDSKYGYYGFKYIFTEPLDPSQTISQKEGQGRGWFHPRHTNNLRMADHDHEVLQAIDGQYLY